MQDYMYISLEMSHIQQQKYPLQQIFDHLNDFPDKTADSFLKFLLQGEEIMF